RLYVYVYVFTNAFDSIVYQLTMVTNFAWDNSFVFIALGYFGGPRAIGVHVVACTAPMALLTMLNLYRYAHVTNFEKFEFLSTQFSVVYVAFWLGFHTLFHYSIATILFQTDGDSIDQVADM
ncbi:hypothetical protein PFISCL1PPCAC_13246, partial [Pristionchus fissidentatus]